MIGLIGNYFATNYETFFQLVMQHIYVSFLAIIVSMIIAIPLGILSTQWELLEKISQNFWGTLRIIPSLAILVLCIPIFGTGIVPSVVALVLLAIPPILINTTMAFKGLDKSIIEAAMAMGMTSSRLFFTIKLPLAFPVVFTGIKTATVEVIASATLAAYIGGGGLGNLIFTGLGLMRYDLLLIGGLSVAILSFSISGLMSLFDKTITQYRKI